MTKGQKTYNGTMIVSSTNGVGKNEQPHGKKKKERN